MNETASKTKSLGVAACTAIVVGNMVGSGFYLSPSALAPFGSLAILAWIVMGAGAMCLGLVFAKSVDDPNTGYALTVAELSPVADGARAATKAVDTRACAP